MVDSIIIRIHSLSQHEELVKFLSRQAGEGFSKRTKVFEDETVRPELLLAWAREHAPDLLDFQLVPGEDGPALSLPDHPTSLRHLTSMYRSFYNEKEFVKKLTLQNYFKDHESGKTFQQTYRNFIRTYHYAIAYGIFDNRDFIEFNFSIPKYLYGNNVMQFVPHYFDKEYTNTFTQDWNELIPIVYKRLRRFLLWFFEKELGGLVNPYFVQVARLDICYNLIFNTPDDAKTYLADVKRIRKKYLRDTSVHVNNYHSGVYFPSTDYTLKVYHKGSEFKKKQAGPLLKQLNWEPKLVADLQNLADRCLRYEVEFSPTYFDKIFKQYIFRKDSKEWKRGRKYYTDMMRDGLTKIKNKKFTLPELDKWRRKLYRYGKFYDGKVFHFYLSSDSSIKLNSQKAWEEIETSKFTFEREQRFGKTLFTYIVKDFLKFYKEFSVQTTTEIDHFLSLVNMKDVPLEMKGRQYHSMMMQRFGFMENHVSLKTLKMLNALLKAHTWEEIQNSDVISRRQLFRVKAMFKKMGFENPASQVIIKPKEGFFDYHREIEKIITKYYLDKYLKSVF